jgi:hypothetical protein
MASLKRKSSGGILPHSQKKSGMLQVLYSERKRRDAASTSRPEKVIGGRVSRIEKNGKAVISCATFLFYHQAEGVD